MLKYSKSDEEFLINNYKDMSISELAKSLNRTTYSINAKARRLKLSKKHMWTIEELDQLKELYPTTNNKTLSRLFNTPVSYVADKASDLGLKKEKGYKFECDLDLFLEKFKETYGNNEYAPLAIELQKHDWSISLMSINRHFGGYRNLCKMFDLKINMTIFNGKAITYYSKNHDICYSRGELIITDFFINNNISYNKEVSYSKYCDDNVLKNKIADWDVDNTYIVEYFGMATNSRYADKMDYKIKLCKENNIKLIDLYEKDLCNLEEKFKKFITNHQNP